jgi:4-hydroxybenzoate polyprenyltransferase
MRRALSTIFELLRLSRAVNSLALALLFIAALRHFGGNFTVLNCLRATSWLLVALISYGYNDVLDVEIDMRNRPRRPIPLGTISRTQATIWVVFLTLCSAVVTVYAWGRTAFWPILGLAGSILYSRVIRSRSALFANVVAALLVTIVAASAELNPHKAGALFFNAFLFCLMVAREFQKDVMDAPGDIGFRRLGVLVEASPILGRVIYVSLLIASCALLVLFTNSESHNGLFHLLWLSCLGILLTAVVRFLSGLGGAREQMLLTKSAAYVTIALLIAGVRQ